MQMTGIRLMLKLLYTWPTEPLISILANVAVVRAKNHHKESVMRTEIARKHATSLWTQN